MELDKFPSYGKFFFLRNQDPGNNVLYKDFYFYSIIMIYVFYFWYIVAVLDNEEHLNSTYSSNYGKVIFYLTLLVSIGTSLILFYMTFTKNEYPSSWAGIVFILLLISMGLCLFTFDRKELDPKFEKDPTSLAAAFLLSYTFVSYFFVK